MDVDYDFGGEQLLTTPEQFETVRVNLQLLIDAGAAEISPDAPNFASEKLSITPIPSGVPPGKECFEYPYFAVAYKSPEGMVEIYARVNIQGEAPAEVVFMSNNKHQGIVYGPFRTFLAAVLQTPGTRTAQMAAWWAEYGDVVENSMDVYMAGSRKRRRKAARL